MNKICDYHQGEDFYRILGVDELATTEQIKCEYKILALQLHPDKQCSNTGGDSSQDTRFADLQRAKDVLCDDSSRSSYDNWRHSGLAISYKHWLSKRDAIHTSLHWAKLERKKPCLPCSGGQKNDSLSSSPSDRSWLECGSWKRESSDVYQMFRNYEI